MFIVFKAGTTVARIPYRMRIASLFPAEGLDPVALGHSRFMDGCPKVAANHGKVEAEKVDEL